MKRDYKRYFKNLLLIFLIAMSFFLVFRLWSVGNYFGTGFKDTFESLFDVIRDPVVSLFGNDKDDSSSKDLKFILSPKRIVANFSDKRSVMNNDDADFLSFYEETIEIMKKIEAGEISIKSVENVSEDDYYAALKGKSVLIDFDSKYDYNLFGVVTGVSGESKLMKNSAVVREFIISMPENVLDYTMLYIKDYSDETVYKFLLEMNKTDMEELLRKRLSEDTLSGTYFYSYELNFHVEQNADGSPVKVVFEPLASVNLMPEAKTGVRAERYVAGSEEINENELLKKFNMNVRSAGKYTDIDGSRNFIEKNATLKISADGYIEYIATEAGKGVKISDISDDSFFDIGAATTVSSEFVTEIFEMLPKSEDDSIRITGDLTEGTSDGKYRICYDYYIGGLPIFQLDKNSGLITNSVVLEIENGYITYYKHYIRTYGYTEEETVRDTMLTAADALVSKMTSGEQMRINKAYECFIDSGEGTPEADWVFEIAGLGGLYR
ncbi:MAG: hypothetical protein IKV88_07070 [Clostridia bacterium]|nr:hypothetical protein [Clostridia bacterium]